MDKACRESFSITLTFPFLLEENLTETQARLQHLARWCEQKNKTIEIVVNDWGTAHLASQFPVLSLCLGVLLNKRKKIRGWLINWEIVHCLNKTAFMRRFTRNI